MKYFLAIAFLFACHYAYAKEYELVLVNDKFIDIAGVQIMSVDYAKFVLQDYLDSSLHIRGHACARSDNLYHLLKHIFASNKNKPLISTYGLDDLHMCANIEAE